MRGGAHLRRRRGARDAARGAAASRWGHLLVPARRAVVRQRPARAPALLHGLPRLHRPHRRLRHGHHAAPAGDPGHPAGAWRGLDQAGRSAGAAAPRPQPGNLPAPVAHRAPAAGARVDWADAPRSARRVAGRSHLRALAARSRPVRRLARGAVGPDRAADREPAVGGGLAEPRGHGLQGRPAARPVGGGHGLHDDHPGPRT